uniref:Uncharacterized protein n=1 Tax=Timema cristinae TaxID=61476 RepID=A0A7R9D6G1_TIMCR|nr:unnamed protein product [Timema cristinae]
MSIYSVSNDQEGSAKHRRKFSSIDRSEDENRIRHPGGRCGTVANLESSPSTSWTTSQHHSQTWRQRPGWLA